MPEDSVPESTPLCDQEWFPYRNQIEFEVADFIFRRNEMPQSQVDDLMNLWAAFCQLNNLDASPPFTNHQDLLDTIDSTPDGSIAWDCVKVSYCGNMPEEPPSWMFQEYEVWFRDAKKVVEGIMSNNLVELL